MLDKEIYSDYKILGWFSVECDDDNISKNIFKILANHSNTEELYELVMNKKNSYKVNLCSLKGDSLSRTPVECTLTVFIFIIYYFSPLLVKKWLLKISREIARSLLLVQKVFLFYYLF